MCTFIFIFISLSLLNILLYNIIEDGHKVGFHRVIERSRQQFIDLLSATSVQLLVGDPLCDAATCVVYVVL